MLVTTITLLGVWYWLHHGMHPLFLLVVGWYWLDIVKGWWYGQGYVLGEVEAHWTLKNKHFWIEPNYLSVSNVFDVIALGVWFLGLSRTWLVQPTVGQHPAMMAELMIWLVWRGFHHLLVQYWCHWLVRWVFDWFRVKTIGFLTHPIVACWDILPTTNDSICSIITFIWGIRWLVSPL